MRAAQHNQLAFVTVRKLDLCSRALRSSTSFARRAPSSFITADKWPSAFHRRTNAWMSTYAALDVDDDAPGRSIDMTLGAPFAPSLARRAALGTHHATAVASRRA